MPESKKKKHSPKRKKRVPKSTEPPFLKHIKRVKPDDEFNFTCSLCADCCRRLKMAVGIEALDVFRLSRYMRQAGNPVWRIENILTEYTTLMSLTDFGYPMFFLNTTEPDDVCVFLASGRCGVHPSKPRVCRMYPLTAEPLGGGEGFDYYIITERMHHYNGPKIRVDDWMNEALDSEDREFTQLEIPYAARIGFLMRKGIKGGVDSNCMMNYVLFFRYFNFDIDEPFMPQYICNNEVLIKKLDELVSAVP